jgi:hypothetical protein
MAFKMKKPSIIQGTSVHKNAIKLNRDMDRTNVADGRAGSSALQKKDFGMEESGMKFRKIGSKIREKLAKRKIIKKTDPAIDSKDQRQDIAETGMVQTKRKRNRLEQFQVDEGGKVVRKRKTKLRGDKKIVKDVDASGKKTKKVLKRGLTGEFDTEVKKKESKTRKLGKTVKGVAAEKRVEGARKGEQARLNRQNEVIKEANRKARELDKAAYDEWAKGKRAEGFEVGPYTETTRKAGPKEAAAKKRSPMKKETETSGKATKTTPGKTTVIKGETTTTPSGSADFNKAFGEACKPGVEFFYYKGEKKTCDRAPSTKKTPDKTVTEPDKTETAEFKGSYKEQPLLEAKRTQGEFGDIDEKQTRKKRPPRGKKGGKISLRNLFRRDKKGRKIMCGPNFAE